MMRAGDIDAHSASFLTKAGGRQIWIVLPDTCAGLVLLRSARTSSPGSPAVSSVIRELTAAANPESSPVYRVRMDTRLLPMAPQPPVPMSTIRFCFADAMVTVVLAWVSDEPKMTESEISS